jgi:hypothetical protein
MFIYSSAIFAYLKTGRIEVKFNKVCEMLQKAYGESAIKKKQKKQNKCLRVV